MKYERLYDKVYENLNTYLELFTIGDLETLNNDFTMEKYTDFGQILVSDNIFNDNNINYENYRENVGLFDKYKTNIHKILDGLQVTKNIYQDTKKCSELKEQNKILYDKELLKEFIEDYYSSFILFDLETTITEVPIIKREYSIYLDLYGIPINGIFDSEKLSNIIKNLNSDNIDLDF